METYKYKWRLDLGDDQGMLVKDSQNKVIATIHNFDKNETANTFLILTAPEMLELLEFLTDMHADGELHDRIATIVRRAKGLD